VHKIAFPCFCDSPCFSFRHPCPIGDMFDFPVVQISEFLQCFTLHRPQRRVCDFQGIL
jgi:hypothetical protein